MSKKELLKEHQDVRINKKSISFSYSISATDYDDMHLRITEGNESMLLSPHAALILLEWLQEQKESLLTVASIAIAMPSILGLISRFSRSASALVKKIKGSKPTATTPDHV